MLYTDYDKFAEKIGILETEQLEALGFENNNENKICSSRLQELQNFVKNLNKNSVNFIKNKKYHIATITSDGDDHDVEGEFCYTISNEIRMVNRLEYLLCDGDDDPDIYLEEIDSYV